LAKKVRADLNGLMIESQVPQFNMINAYSSVLPLSNDALKVKRNIHTEGLAAFFPFSSPFLDVEDGGVLLGLNKNKIPYIKDVFKLNNANGLILATSGSGKSYFTKLFLSRQYMNGAGIIVIDPQGEYLAIAEHYGGETITISKNSDTIINPLDLMGHDYMEKRLSLMDLFKIMFGDLTEVQKAILDKAIDLTYAKFNITRDSQDNSNPPLMQDLYETLATLEKKCVNVEKVTYRALLNRLGMYAKDGVFNFLNKKTEIKFEKDFVVFNIGSMPKQVKPVIMYLVLDYVYLKMKENLKRKILVIDEAWSLLQTAEESSYIFEIVKTCRKFNLGLLMITQDVADLVGSRAGHAVLANTSYTFLLRQKPAIINSIVQTFHLSNMEKEFLITCQKGNGILILENEHEELEVIASKKEHELITTNPDEMIKKNEQKKGETKVIEVKKNELDIDQDVHPNKNLSVNEQNFLFNHGYTLDSFVDIEKKNQEEFFVKERHPESSNHVFLVDRIKSLLEKKTKTVERYYTQKADLLFKNKKGELIAIEVETGMDYRKHKSRIDEKMERLRKEFGNNLFIVLTDSLVRCSYEKYGFTLLLRKNVPGFIESQF
jgi:type IV secretory pathway VirB4 component